METEVVTLRRKPLADGGQIPSDNYYVYVNQKQVGIATSRKDAFRTLAMGVFDRILHEDFKSGEILYKSKIIYSISTIDETGRN